MPDPFLFVLAAAVLGSALYLIPQCRRWRQREQDEKRIRSLGGKR